MGALKALLLSLAALMLLGCDNEASQPKERGDHVFGGQVEAIDKARGVEKILQDKSKQSQSQ